MGDLAPSVAERPRIATVIAGLGVGGAETSLLRLVERTRNEFDHVILSIGSDNTLAPRFRDLGVPVHELNVGGPLRRLRGIVAGARLLRRARPALMVVQMYPAVVPATAMRLLGARHAPMIWYFHATPALRRRRSWRPGLTRRLQVALARWTDRVVYAGSASAAGHHALGFPDHKSVVVPNGIDLALFAPHDAARQRVRRELGFDDAELVIGHVGRAHPMKDHASLVQAMEIVRGRVPRARLLLCGPGVEGLPWPDGYGGWLRALGTRHDIPDVMNACDIGVLCSAFGESFGIVLAEFMACQRPCVTTDIGDAAQVVGPYGRVVPRRDAAALAEALLDLAGLLPGEREALGAAAREHVAQNFEIGTVAARHAELWRSVIAGNR
jgi:glycosyltransferase involved in cell wall biosynthesis